jgi:hypothetical protein
MRDSATPAPAAQRSTVAFDGFKEPAGGRRWATFDFPAIRPQPASQNLEHYAESSSGWSAKHDFEQRVGRNGIKISEAIDNTATNTTVLPVVQKRSGARSTLDGYAQANTHRANHQATRSELLATQDGDHGVIHERQEGDEGGGSRAIASSSTSRGTSLEDTGWAT